MPTRITPQVQALITNLIGGAANVPGDRALIANTVAGAPFSGRTQTAALWLQTDPSAGNILNRPTPWLPPAGLPPEIIRPGTPLDSVTWHTAKHRLNGDFDPATLVHEYLDDLRVASRQAVQTGTVVVGIDAKSGGPRAGLVVRLGNQGAPCTHVVHHPGGALFIAFDPQAGVVVTGFPVAFRSVRNGYPYWQNRVEVTL